MIQRVTVNKRPATAIYLDSQFRPVDRDSALVAMVKLTFLDHEGGIVFLTPDEPTVGRPVK